MPSLRWFLQHLIRAPDARHTGDGEPARERFQRIAREQLDSIWRTARRLGAAPAELDDVAQEVLSVVFVRLARIERGKEHAFVMAVTSKVTANLRRARQRGNKARDELARHPFEERGWQRRTNPDYAHEVSRALQLLDGALSAMTEPQRVVFVLTDLEQLTAREVADQLQLPEAAVVSRLRRAREVLARHLEQLAPGEYGSKNLSHEETA
jgi:RNA polymerase sigma-70 factor (ECF subfamily)